MSKIRQVATTLDGIRDDHKERYRFAIEQARARSDVTTVLDIGCGVGYGSWMMADAGFDVVGIERDADAVQFARDHYGHPHLRVALGDLADQHLDADMVTAFEIIEHTPDALPMLTKVEAKLLVGSVPNEDAVPFVPGKVNAEHYRHFTPSQITDVLAKCGWVVTYMGYQPGKRGDAATIQDDPEIKRTIVFAARRAS